MSVIDVMQVCLNGHKINGMSRRYREENRKNCHLCGASTITQCPKCKYSIRGDSVISFTRILEKVPFHCESCGETFPWKDKLMEGKSIGKGDPEIQIINIFSKFHSIVRDLRKRREDRPTLDVKDEYDVQDLLRALLNLYFEDVRPEEWTSSYAGACSRIDFLLKNEQCLIEIKKTRENLKDKKIGEELMIDIERYKTHPNCKNLFCFVYDPDGYIDNAAGLEGDLSREEDGLNIKVFIFPKN